MGMGGRCGSTDVGAGAGPAPCSCIFRGAFCASAPAAMARERMETILRMELRAPLFPIELRCHVVVERLLTAARELQNDLHLPPIVGVPDAALLVAERD